MKTWKPTANDIHYYWIEDSGLIIGQAHCVFNSTVWIAKVSSKGEDDTVIGKYITLDFAKKAVEHYWNIQERTLSHESNN